MIIKEDPPIPDKNVDTTLSLIIMSMLQKNHLRRPTVFEIANIPIIKEYIVKFGKKHNCMQSIEPFIN